MFADDAVLIARSPENLQKTLNKFLKFCGDNSLKVNAAKTKVMGVNCEVTLVCNGTVLT